MNNFSYADDLVLFCPCASALNDLLLICSAFALKSYIVFNIKKTECMCICPKGMKLTTLPDICLDQSKIEYVNQFKYLGHILDTSFTDDNDMSKELRNLYARGNMLTKQFRSLDNVVKIQLFKTYCYPLYCVEQLPSCEPTPPPCGLQRHLPSPAGGQAVGPGGGATGQHVSYICAIWSTILPGDESVHGLQLHAENCKQRKLLSPMFDDV